MVKKYAWIGVACAAAVAVFLIFFVDWEARAVKKHLRSLSKQMTWAPAESELTMASRIRHVQEGIADVCQVHVPSYNFSREVDNRDVSAYMMMAKNYYKHLSVKLEDLNVESIELPRAKAVATAYVRATTADGQSNDEALVVEFRLEKAEKKWRLVEAYEIQILEK